MLEGEKNYTEPVIKMGSLVTSVPAGSTKKKEQAKKIWEIVYYVINPETGKKERQREKLQLNRIKDYDEKLAAFTDQRNAISKALAIGYNPYINSDKVKKKIIGLTLKEAKEEFIDYHRAKNSRPKTISSFNTKMRMILSYFGDDKIVSEITTVDVTNLMLYWEKLKKWEGKTFNNSKFVFVNFFNYLESVGRIETSPFLKFREKRKSLESTAHEVFSDADFTLIKAWLKENDPYCWFCLQFMYYTCVRPFELIQLESKYVDVVNKKVTIPAKISKNKKTETVSLDKGILTELKKIDLSSGQYLIGATRKDEVNIVGNKLHPQKHIYDKFVDCLEALDLKGKNYTLYSIKHFSNTKRVLSGAWSPNALRIANRHSSIQQQRTYIRGAHNAEQVEVPEM